MSGAGFLAGTTSPAHTPAIRPRVCSPTTDRSTASTLFAAEVEATATCHPASSASSISRFTPGRPGSRPWSTSSM